jgi:prepilin-type N-terminal cleavage/methylation domain-containing protein
MDSDTTMNTKRIKHDLSRLAFTLIEMLMVITIMGIVATLVVTMGVAASQKKKIVAVQGEEEKLITMIENYHNKLNYYPPDNGLLAGVNYLSNPSLYDGLAATNPLIYELTGATNLSSGANLAVFNSPSITASEYNKVFNRGGIANGDALEPHNFFQPGPAPKEVAPYAIDNNVWIAGLIVPTDLVPGNTNNFWHYDSSSTNRHNMNTYDLWAEYSIGNIHGQLHTKTNGNW